jgi:hypothetical protein
VVSLGQLSAEQQEINCRSDSANVSATGAVAQLQKKADDGQWVQLRFSISDQLV